MSDQTDNRIYRMATENEGVNQMSDEEILKVVRAAQDHRFDDIEKAFLHRDAPTCWIPLDGASLNFDAFIYRLKPQPREWFMALHDDGAITVSDQADDFRVDAHACEVVKVREVLP